MAEAIKTIKIKIINPNKRKEDALSKTVSLLNCVLETYLKLTHKHNSLLVAEKEEVNKKTGEVCRRKWHNSEILTELEKLSLPTKAHPKTEIDIKSLFEGLPTNWRRSVINTATGMVKSYITNLKNWERNKKGNPPSEPQARNLPTFYKGTYQFQIVERVARNEAEVASEAKQTALPRLKTLDNLFVAFDTHSESLGGEISGNRMWNSKFRHPISPPECQKQQDNPQIELLDIKNQFVRLKVFDGTQWVWKNYPVKLGSKQLEQLNNPSWTIQSPTLVPKQTKRGIEWYLHIPLLKKVFVKPIEEQKKANPNLTTLAVDLGLRHLAVVTVRQQPPTPFGKGDGRIVFVKFFRGEEVEAHREKHLQKVFRKQLWSGKPVRGERSNKLLWRHIRDTNQDIAHQITKEIVEIAKQFDVKVIVIEYLYKFQAFRGGKRSKKLNRRLTYWLKGQIEEQLRYKAFAEGILVKSVNPAFTSQICNKCGGFGERFSHKSLFRCHFCGYEANADFNASCNLHKVFWNIFPRPSVRCVPRRLPSGRLGA